MADGYSFSLLVELQNNPNIPKLKNKLVKYFQSKKANGGDCQVDYGSGTSAVVRFQTEDARQKVLGKQVHEISLDQGVVKLTVRLPEIAQKELAAVNPDKTSGVANNSPVSGDGHTPPAEAQKEVGSTSAVLGNLEESMKQEYLEMLVENILSNLTSGSDSPTASNFFLEILPDTCFAVVTFPNGQVNSHFISKCTTNRMFMRKKLSVRPLEITTKVKVEDIPLDCTPDHLLLYFERDGEAVEDVSLNEDEQSAIITFQDPKAVDRIIEKKHHFDKQPIKTFPFYESLGTALYGKDRPTLKLPPPLHETIDWAIWKYLSGNQGSADTINSDLAKHFCKVDLQQPTVKLSPIPALLQQKGIKAKYIEQWKDTVKSAFTQALSKFKSLEFQVEATSWEESEGEINKAVSDKDVVVVSDKARCVMAVVGLVENVSKLEKPLKDSLGRIAKRIQREKSSITEEIKMSPSIYNILLQDGLQDKMVIEHPELKMTYNRENQSVNLFGLMNEVFNAHKKVVDGVVGLKHKMLEWDNYLVEFLRGEDQEKLTSSLFTSKRITAALEIHRNGVQLLAVSEEVLSEAEDHLNMLLISQYIDIEDSNVLKMPEWQDLVTHLNHSSGISLRKVQIQISRIHGSQQVVVSGYKDCVLSVRKELDDFLHQHTEVEESLEVKPEAIAKFIQEHKRNAWSGRVNDTLKVSFKEEAISFSGARVDVQDCKATFEDLVASTCFSVLKVSKPGAKKLFQDNNSMYTSTVLNQTGCLVQLVEEDDIVMASKHNYQLQTLDGVEIAVCKADISGYAVQAVVNRADSDLKHNGGLAGAILAAAGPRLQDECDQIITSRGQLKPGDCVITGAGGRLRCKSIIHAVGPRFNTAHPQKAIGQLRRVVKGSLDLAEANNCLSVALPAISSGNLGFPLTLCAETIAKAVKDYCEDKFEENTLRKIHLVNMDDKTVQAMEAAVRKEFGDHGTSHPEPSGTISSSQPQHVDRVQSMSSSDRVQTKEGLTLVLIKGNIQDAKTEVLVNTVGEDLVLKSGAVSNAIFSAAGPQLQALINKQASSGRTGDIIITNGCNLKSANVFHTIAPRWDNGQGAAQKILSKIVKECLGHAEQRKLVSMTFPAIGTGNLGFPKDLVASLMLNEVLNFSSKKQPQNLKEVVFILHPSDPQTIQAFHDEFNKMFTTPSSGASAAASTKQTKGTFSKVTSSSGMYETKVGEMVIQVVTGDITKETTDVIVNSSNKDFNLKTGVSKAILDAAGQTVEAECQQLGALANTGMIMTQQGNLQSKAIIHLHHDPQGIHKSVKDALLMCAKGNYTSISLPALGTGQAGAQAGQVADAMLDAVVDIVSHKSQNTLNLVRIVVFQPAMAKEFYTSMQKREGPEDTADIKKKEAPKDTADIKDSFLGKVKSFFSWGSTPKPQQDEDFVVEGKQVDPACFHICGHSQGAVDHAKQLINDLISKEQYKNCITDNAILHLTPADRQRILDMQNTMDVTVSLEHKLSQATVTIEGMSRDVLKAVSEIHAMLQRARDDEDFNKKVEIASNIVEWQYQQQGGQFQSFDPIPNFHLEQALQGQRTYVEVTLQGQIYKVLIPDGPATDGQGNSLNIRRIDKIAADSLPSHWDAMPANTSFMSFTIQPGSTEYNDVENRFKATCPRNITKIERIQNPSMWRSVQIRKREMELRNGHQNNEKQLFHGTCPLTIKHINHNGFNRSYAGKNAAAYGNGTYFAVNASYSAHDKYSKPDPQGQKSMYLCQVLTGDFTIGQQGMIVPPAKNSTSTVPLLYDSVTDNLSTPSMFVVFHDCQAYPEYLITFK